MEDWGEQCAGGWSKEDVQQLDQVENEHGRFSSHWGSLVRERDDRYARSHIDDQVEGEEPERADH